MNKKLSGRGKHTHFLLGSACLLLSGSAFAVDIGTTFSASVGRTDNVLRTDDDQIEETIATIGLEFDLAHFGRKLSAEMYLNGDFIDYRDDSFDNELEGGATVLAGYWFIQDRLSWNLQYNYGQQVFDPLAPIRPDNRENVGFLTTGPSLELPIGSRWEFGASAEYSDTTYELNPNEQIRTGGRVSFARLLNAGRSLGLVATQENVEYDQSSLVPDFDRRAVFLSFESANTRGTFTLDFGVNELQLEGSDEKSDGTLIRLDWRRILSPGVEMTVGAGSRYSDQGDIFRFFQNTSFDLRDTADVAGVGSPMRNNYGSLIFDLERARTSIDFVLLHSDEDYELDSTLDRRITQLNFAISRDISRKTFAELGINASSRKFEATDRDDQDFEYTLSLGYRFTSAFSGVLSYQNFNRDSNQGLTEFDENRVFLRFNYVPRWSR